MPPGAYGCEGEPGGCAEEGGGGGGEEVLGTMAFERSGRGAHTADVISCADIATDNPHRSKHFPDTVNWEVRFQCTGVVLDVRMRLVLFWEGEEIAETGYMPKGNTAAAKQRVTAPCISGWYRGWAYADLRPPPG
jgi:hypothetical protein